LNFRNVMLLVGLVAAYNTDALAAPTVKPVFQFTNQTSATVDIGVGTVKKPPKTANIEVQPKEHYPALKVLPAIDPNDGPELLLEADGKQVVYRFDAKAIKAGKSVIVDWKTLFASKKNVLSPQMKVKNITAKEIEIVEKEEPAVTEPDEPGDSDNGDDTATNNDDKDKEPPEDEEPADEPAPKPKPTLSVTPEKVLGVTPSMKGDTRDAKILGLRFSSVITTATTEPDDNKPAHLVEQDWKKVKKARLEITAAHGALVNTWKKVSSTAKNIMKRLKVEDSEEQEALAEEVLDLVNLTYKNVKARFAYEEGEKPADEPADDDSSSSDDE